MVGKLACTKRDLETMAEQAEQAPGFSWAEAKGYESPLSNFFFRAGKGRGVHPRKRLEPQRLRLFRRHE